MFESQNTFPLFPTMLSVFRIPRDATTRMNTELTDMLDRLIAEAPEHDNPFLQTEHDLHTLPEMMELNGYLMNAVGEILRILSTKHKDMLITGCWANIHPSDNVHRAHSHPNNFLSAVYYVTTPPEGNQIVFYDPRIQHYILTPPVVETNTHNSDHKVFEIEEGMLLVFPSWLVHSVPAGNSKARRISISYNLNFLDFSERISPPRWQANVPTHPGAG